MLTITGNYFSDSSSYPLLVYVGGETCTVINTNLTTIQCQIPSISITNQSQYQGGSRGLQLFHCWNSFNQVY
jgi:hypothetical protein